MSKMHSQPFERINKLVEKHGEEGLKLLFIFKTVKKAVIQRIEDETPNMDWQQREDEINKESMKVAREIFNRSGRNPTEEDIKKVLNYL